VTQENISGNEIELRDEHGKADGQSQFDDLPVSVSTCKLCGLAILKGMQDNEEAGTRSKNRRRAFKS
jgi:hypothetical protein